VLGRVHELRDRQRLDLKLSETNHELQRKARELTAIIHLGKAVVSINDHRVLFQKIVEGAAQVGEADIVWLLVREEENKSFLLTAQRGLPEVWSRKMNMPLDDGMSGLVALSGETLSIAGDPLLKFRIANLGKSACAIPVKVQKEVVGMLVAVRKEARSFERVEQTLLEAVANTAAISLVNARLFQALSSAAQASKQSLKQQNALLESLRSSITEDLQAAIYPIDLMLTETPGPLTDEQRQALQTARAALQRLGRAAEKTTPPVHRPSKKK
jgi:GAF domain-containing protein